MTKDRGEHKQRQRPPRAAPGEQPRREPRPIDAAQLRELALGYAARYATTAAKLQRYLDRKLRERLWTADEPADVAGLVARIVALGYVDDRAFAASRQRDLTARGFGIGRVRQALAAAGVSREDVSAAIAPPDGAPAEPFGAAIAFARRRRFGPFARPGTTAAISGQDRLRRELAAMARAGHGFDVSRRVLTAPDEAAALQLAEDY